MPTSTFFRLPQEKRQRLVDAAWEEFSADSFAQASINQIVHRARIPRGSFYQYFSDKEDLFWYLMGEMREYFIRALREELLEVEGDLFALPLKVYDRFVGRQGAFDPVFSRFIQVMRLNQGMDFQHCLASKAEQMMPESLAQCVRTEELKRGDRAFAENIFFLTMAILAFAIMETLRDPEQRDGQRRLLEDRVEIVRAGGTARRNAAGEAPEQCFKGGDPC